MTKFISTLAAAFGLALGAGLIYALYISESARLLAMFLLGAFLFGSTVLITVLLVNRQWSRVIGEQKTSYHHTYRINGPTSRATWEPERQQELLPAPPQEYIWSLPEQSINSDNDNETIA